jgi:hypothetical protein
MPVELDAEVVALDVVALDDDAEVVLPLELIAPPVPDAEVVSDVVPVVVGPCDVVVADDAEPVVAPPRPFELRAQELPQVSDVPNTKRSAKRPFMRIAYRPCSEVA